jgi:hypothetical protein
MVPNHAGGYDACHLCSRSNDPFGSAHLAALFYPSFSCVLVKTVFCRANDLCGYAALSCSRVRIFSAGDTNLRSPVHAGGIFCSFYQHICRALDDAPSGETGRNPATILKWIQIAITGRLSKRHKCFIVSEIFLINQFTSSSRRNNMVKSEYFAC